MSLRPPSFAGYPLDPWVAEGAEKLFAEQRKQGRWQRALLCLATLLVALATLFVSIVE